MPIARGDDPRSARNDGVEGARPDLSPSGEIVSPPSRQLALAPQPQVLVGLQLGHAQQIMQHIELVPLGERAQDGRLLGDEGDGLIDAALPWFLTARARRA